MGQWDDGTPLAVTALWFLIICAGKHSADMTSCETKEVSEEHAWLQSSWAEPQNFCLQVTLQAATWTSVMYTRREEPVWGWLLVGWLCHAIWELGDRYTSAQAYKYICMVIVWRENEYNFEYGFKSTFKWIFTQSQSMHWCNKTADDVKIFCLTQTCVLSGSGILLFYFIFLNVDESSCLIATLCLHGQLTDSVHFSFSWYRFSTHLGCCLCCVVYSLELFISSSDFMLSVFLADSRLL